MLKNVVDTEATNDVTIWRLRVECWISKATCTHTHAHSHALGKTRPPPHTHRQICNTYCFSKAIIIRKRASVLSYTYIVCLVYVIRRKGNEFWNREVVS
jgi:hypothetical protein